MEILRRLFGKRNILEDYADKIVRQKDKFITHDYSIFTNMCSLIDSELEICEKYIEDFKNGVIPWKFYSQHRDQLEKLERMLKMTKALTGKNDYIQNIHSINNAFSPPRQNYQSVTIGQLYFEAGTSDSTHYLTPEDKAKIIKRQLTNYRDMLSSLKEEIS